MHAPVSLPFSMSETGLVCGYDYASQTDIIAPVERTNVIGRFTWQMTSTDRLFAEYNQSHNHFVFRTAPTPDRVPYPADGPFYPTEFAAANGLSGDLFLRYRTIELGPRTNSTTTDANRLVFGAEGTVGAWSYSTAANFTQSKATDAFTSGFVSQAGAGSCDGDGILSTHSGPPDPRAMRCLRVHR